MNVAGMVSRLVSTWHKAGPSRVDGMDWYPIARWEVARMASAHRVPITTVAGVIAALSPRLQWGPNLRAARAVLAGQVPTGVFRASLHKAQRIARGVECPLDVLGGPKVRAFYAALAGDDSAAVVDVWVLRAVKWTSTVTDKAYAAITRALTLAARKVGTTVTQLQAVAWVAVRGRAA